MGLDVDFYIPGSEDPVLDMRHHFGFLEMLLDQPTEPVRPGYDDFWVDTEVLDGVEDMLMEYLSAAGLTPYDLPTVSDEYLGRCRPQDCSSDTLLMLYARALRILRSATTEHGPLICSWSA